MADATPDPRTVLVVYGRNEKLRAGFFTFLRSLDLLPIEWDAAVELTGQPSPYVGEVLKAAFRSAQAIAVLLTPDDEVRVAPELKLDHDPPDETEYRRQPRANVLIEAGMALMLDERRTVLIKAGDVKIPSDLGGRHIPRLTNDAGSRQRVADRLAAAGCRVNRTGIDWQTAGDLSLGPAPAAAPAPVKAAPAPLPRKTAPAPGPTRPSSYRPGGIQAWVPSPAEIAAVAAVSPMPVPSPGVDAATVSDRFADDVAVVRRIRRATEEARWQIIRAIVTHAAPQGGLQVDMSELAEELEMPESSYRDDLLGLRDSGYVDVDAEDGGTTVRLTGKARKIASLWENISSLDDGLSSDEIWDLLEEAT